MATIILEDDCLGPNREVILNYNGPNPIRAYHVLKRKMREIWEVEAIAYWEREFRWDASSNPHEFVVKSYVDRGMDRFTRIRIEVFIQGWQPDDPTKDGKLEMRIGGVLITRFGGTTFFEDARNPLFRILMWLYVRLFYQNQRIFYLNEWCYNRINKFKRFYQEMFNMTPVEERAV